MRFFRAPICPIVTCCVWSIFGPAKTLEIYALQHAQVTLHLHLVTTAEAQNFLFEGNTASKRIPGSTIR